MKLQFLLLAIPTVVSFDFTTWIFELVPPESPECYVEYKQLEKCVKPHNDFIVSNINEVSKNDFLYNISLLNDALQIGRNISDCIGRDFNCELPKMVVFALDNADYIGKKLYGDAFHCFIDADALQIHSSCSQKLHISEPDVFKPMLRDPIVYKTVSSNLFDCVARRLSTTPSCTIDRIISVYQAMRAIMDVSYQFQRWNAKYLVEWEFDGQQYCDN